MIRAVSFLLLLSTGLSVVAQEWNFKNGLISNGQVTVKSADGQSSDYSSNSGAIKQSSVSTVPMIVQTGGGGEGYTFDAAIRMDDGTVYTREEGLGIWLEWRQSDFEDNFNYESYESLSSLFTQTESREVSVRWSVVGTARTREEIAQTGQGHEVTCRFFGVDEKQGTSQQIGVTKTITHPSGDHAGQLTCFASTSNITLYVGATVKARVYLRTGIHYINGTCNTSVYGKSEVYSWGEAESLFGAKSGTYTCDRTSKVWERRLGSPLKYYGFGDYYWWDDGTATSYPGVSTSGISYAWVLTSSNEIYSVKYGDFVYLNQGSWEWDTVIENVSSTPSGVYTGLSFVGESE